MNRRLKMHELSVGRPVVVNTQPDATIYYVKETRNYQISLVYYAGGQEISGGVVDYSLCMAPNDEQLNRDMVKDLRPVVPLQPGARA